MSCQGRDPWAAPERSDSILFSADITWIGPNIQKQDVACHLQAFGGLPCSFHQIRGFWPSLENHWPSLENVKAQNIEGQLSWWDRPCVFGFWVRGVSFQLPCAPPTLGVSGPGRQLCCLRGRVRMLWLGGRVCLTVQTFLRTRQVCPNVKPHQARALY